MSGFFQRQRRRGLRAVDLALRALRWPVRHGRLPARREARLFLALLLDLVPGPLKLAALLPYIPPSPLDPGRVSRPELAVRGHPIDTRRSPAAVSWSQLPVRVLMCGHNLNLEGAPISQLQLAIGLKRRGVIAPEVLSPLNGPLAQRYRDAGIPVHIFEDALIDVHHRLDGFAKRIEAFRRAISGLRIDVIFGATVSNYWVIHAAAAMRIPAIWNIRESVDWRSHFDELGRDQVEKALSAFTLPYRVVFVAHATRALFSALNSHDNFSVIHNGLERTSIDAFRADLDRSAARLRIGCPQDRTVITIVGTVCPRKRQHDFVRAAIELLRRGPRNLFFYIVGCRPGPYQDALNALVQPYARYFGLVPETDEVYSYLRASDVFVCASAEESYPRVVLEAMAFELPIVTTPVFGIAEQVVHDVSALTYTPGDTLALANHLERLSEQPEERARLSAGARDALSSLTSYDEMVGSYEVLMKEAFLTGEGDRAALP